MVGRDPTLGDLRTVSDGLLVPVMTNTDTLALNYEDSVTLLGASPAPFDLLDQALRIAPNLVAADGGADAARAHGSIPKAIIGDMDSIGNLDSWQNSGIQIRRIAEQTTTDFEKCLRLVQAPVIIGVGLLGGRNDHALAAMSALVANPDRAILLLDVDEVMFHCPTDLRIDLPPGTRVSLFPLRPVTGLRSEGLNWSVDGLSMAPGGRVGTSNLSTGGQVRLAFDGPGVLVILPRTTLRAAITALQHR